MTEAEDCDNLAPIHPRCFQHPRSDSQHSVPAEEAKVIRASGISISELEVVVGSEDSAALVLRRLGAGGARLGASVRVVTSLLGRAFE